MANFSPELFFDLAKHADKQDKYFKGLDAKLPGRFDPKEDVPKIEEFKDAIFMVIMLRAARYMELTRQSDNMSQEDKHAFADFGIVLFSSDVHPPTSTAKKDIQLRHEHQQDIMKTAHGILGPIPRKTVRSFLDGDISSKILDHFDDTVLALACKNPD